MAYKFNLVVSEDAHKDIDEIVSYIVNELQNPQAAGHFLDDVEQAYIRISDNPYLFALCSDTRLQKLGYRKVVIKNYLVLYREDEETNTVYVVRIVYGGRDYAKLL
jgi:plasmid stabilization system protein ParE